jgi:DNA repair photolyase
MAKGRGALGNPPNRYASFGREAVDDGWPQEDEAPRLRTSVREETAGRIITENDSPDVPFDRSINAYRGCEHGCIYCYARPSHAYLGLSPGLDFETKLIAKPNAAAALRAELAKPGYRASPISLGANTDPYQPIERDYQITRSVIEVLAEHRHPFTIVTKSALVERDIDLLAPLARQRLVHVFISLAMLDGEVARRLEPRAAAPQRRLRTIQSLSAAGIPVGVLVAPVIPLITEPELEKVIAAAAQAGATSAACIVLRLPLELADLFKDWLREHYPQRAAHVMSHIHDMRGGRDNDPRFGSRMRGQGHYAELIHKRFALAMRRAGLEHRQVDLDSSQFTPPSRGEQLALF